MVARRPYFFPEVCAATVPRSTWACRASGSSLDTGPSRGQPPAVRPGGLADSDGVDATPPDVPVCSARGCRKPARYALLWNNPRLHTPDRRKTWMACEEHRGSLAGFLSARDFLRETRPL